MSQPSSSPGSGTSATAAKRLREPAPVPLFRAYADVPNSCHAANTWPRPPLRWLRRRRWLLRQPSSGRWLVNLVPGDEPGQWRGQWSAHVSRGLQFATEAMGRRVFQSVMERLGDDLELRAMDFVAAPSEPTQWRPMHG
jgi:hypothetical protein